MNLLLFLLLLGISATTIAVKNPYEKCLFRDTIDLTNHTLFENGSYLYHDILIPQDKVAHYQYRLEFLNKSLPTKGHMRGCVCDEQQARYCIKLCCERDAFFNETASQCEKIPPNFLFPTNMTIRTNNDREKEVNIFDNFVYQVGLPCRRPEVLSENTDIWNLLEDGKLFVYNDEALLDTISYCLTPYRYDNSDEYVYMPMSCPMKNEATFSLLLNTYGMVVSVVFLIPTILVYLFLKELRKNLRSKVLICYLISMLFGYSIIMFINISQTRLELVACRLMGYLGYFFFMAMFFWLSVLCFDIWSGFRDANSDFHYKKTKKRFILYSVYAWGLAALLTAMVAWAQWSDSVPELYKPGIGVDICWLDTRKWSSAIYFYGPNSVILIINIITFSYMTGRLYQARHDFASTTRKEKFFQENAIVLLRLFLLMGISWCMDILSYCIRQYQSLELIFILTDFCNAIQGLLIFILFVLKRDVWSLLKSRIHCKKANEATMQRRKSSISMTTTSLS